MKIAIMQPYFIPYAGYLRLFCAADLFVIYDCVQFPRRGWVHRNQLYNAKNELNWITLPLLKQPMDVKIKDLRFRDDSEVLWQHELNQFKAMEALTIKYPKLFEILKHLKLTPRDYLVNCLKEVCHILDLPFNIAFSSQLDLDPNVKGQERIIKIVKYFAGTDYINSPGGTALYDPDAFARQDIKLHFLTGYQGEYCSIIENLISLDPEILKTKLLAQTQFNQE